MTFPSKQDKKLYEKVEKIVRDTPNFNLTELLRVIKETLKREGWK